LEVEAGFERGLETESSLEVEVGFKKGLEMEVN